jgi:hypothetical protein
VFGPKVTNHLPHHFISVGQQASFCSKGVNQPQPPLRATCRGLDKYLRLPNEFLAGVYTVTGVGTGTGGYTIDVQISNEDDTEVLRKSLRSEPRNPVNR